MKKAHIAVAALLVIAAAGIYLWFHSPLNALVKAGIENFGSEITQAKVRVSRVNLSPRDGKGMLAGLSLGNPKGFKTDHAFEASRIELALEPASLADDVILIHRIAIESPDIVYEKSDGGTNFEAIQRNVERYAGTGKTENKKETGKPGKKMIIDSLTIRGIKVNYNGMINLNLPDIELRNIGKKNGGATSAQVVKAIVSELNTQLTIAVAKTVAIGAVGGVAVGVGMGIKSLLGK